MAVPNLLNSGNETPTSAKLRLLQVLRQRLTFVHWNPETLLLLGRLLTDLLDLLVAPSGRSDSLLRELVSQLAQTLQVHQRQGTLDSLMARERILHYLDEILRLGLPTPAAVSVTNSRPPIALWIGSPPPLLARTVELAGFFLQILEKSVESLPTGDELTVAIVDGDAFLSDKLGDRQRFLTLRHRLGNRLPLIWLSRRGDLQARLDADQLGVNVYLTLPITASHLTTVLIPYLPSETRPPVLLVSPNTAEVGTLSQKLEVNGFSSQILTQGRRFLEALHERPPSLILIDDNLEDPPLIVLLRVWRGHPDFDRYPCIILISPDRAAVLESQLVALGVYLLPKPVQMPILLATMRGILQQSHRQQAKIGQGQDRDPMTGLLSFERFRSLLQFHREQWAHQPQTLVVLRVNNLRDPELADLEAGELLMSLVVHQLRRVVGHYCVGGRLDFAHIGLLLPQAAAEHVLAQAQQLHEALLSFPLSIDGVPLRLSLAIGVVSTKDAPAAVIAWLHQAQQALETAMKQTPMVALSPMQGPSANQLLPVIRRAFEQQQLSLAFQAVVGLGPLETTERYEVLLRVHNRCGRPLPPLEVFEVAQRHELGTRLDRWVIVHALSLMQQRQQRRLSLPYLFINLSAATLEETAFSQWLYRGLDKIQIPTRHLIFEIPESFVETYKMPLERFLLSMGVQEFGLSLDGFGLHKNSLQRLQELPINYVKLSSQFAHRLVDQPEQQRRLRQLVEQLGTSATVILTGVEDAPTLYTAWSCGIRYAQGYYLQRPQMSMSWEVQGNGSGMILE